MIAELTREEIEQGLEGLAAEVLDQTGLARPPIDARRVAVRLGLRLIRDDRQTGRARYVRLSRPPYLAGRRDAAAADPPGRGAVVADRPTILLRDDPRPERMQWAVAHEIGEHLAARLFDAWGLDVAESPRLREQAANRFAAHLLLPGEWFRDEGRRLGWDLPALKERFATASHELIARRMLDWPEPAAVISIFDQGRLVFRAENRRGRQPDLTGAERAAQQAAHRSGEPAARADERLRVRAWPIHEPHWRREILRSEPLWPEG